MNTIEIIKDGKSYEQFDNVHINFKGDNASVKIIEPTHISQLYITLGNNGKVFIDEKVEIWGNLALDCPAQGTTIYIGKHVNFGGVYVQSMNESNLKLKIGDECLFGWEIIIRLTDGHTIFDEKTNQVLNIPKGITIGNHVWFGQNVTLLKSACIGNNCVVGMKSIVTKSFNQNNVIIAGVPAKIIREGINWSFMDTEQFHNSYLTINNQ